MQKTKRCTKCKRYLVLSGFYHQKGKSGKLVPRSICKTCFCHAYGHSRNQPAEELLGVQKAKRFKYCRICKRSKPITRFGKNAKIPDGFQAFCLKCFSDRMKKYWADRNAKRNEAILAQGVKTPTAPIAKSPWRIEFTPSPHGVTFEFTGKVVFNNDGKVHLQYADGEETVVTWTA